MNDSQGIHGLKRIRKMAKGEPFRMKYFCIVLLLTLFSVELTAQTYLPLDTANVLRRKEKATEYADFKKKMMVDFKKTYSRKDKSYITSLYTRQTENFKEDLEGGSYVFDKRFNEVVDSIVELLCRANKEIPADMKFYISRNISLNALCMGDKTFIINMGAFYYLNNEHQLAGILSHEIAHLMLEHGLQLMQANYKVEKIDTKANLSRIKSGKYNKGSKALESYKALLYANKNLNRHHEEEADSLGFVLYRKAGFAPYEYINSYKLAMQYDSIKPMGLVKDTYRKMFDLQDMPFQESWFTAENFKVYDYSKYKDKFDKDSLRSHPDPEIRIKKLQHHFKELKDSVASMAASSNFLQVKEIAKYEQIPSLIITEHYGLGIYICLLRLQEDPGNAYYRSLLGNLFNKIYEARKTYLLNRYLERVNPEEQSESYQQFLNFIWNLNMKEIKSIADFYSAS